MKKAEYADLARDRIITAEKSLEPWKYKVHKLRRAAAGDPSAFGNGAGAQDVGEDEIKNFRKFYSIFVAAANSGRSNQIQQGLRTLLYQSAYTRPDIEFDDVEDQEEILNAQWFRIRAGEPPRGCNMNLHMRMALLDMMVGGLGWATVGTKDGVPICEQADSLDVAYDQGVLTPGDARWVAHRRCEPWSYWAKVYGKAFTVYHPDGVDRPDMAVDLWHYYDVEDYSGNYIVFRSGNEGMPDGDPVNQQENPYYYAYHDDQDQEIDREYYLPLEPIYQLMMPSVRNPVSMVEQVLPLQIARHQIEETFQKVLRRLPALDEIEEGAYDEASLKALKRGDYGTLLIKKQDRRGLQRLPAGEVPSALIEWMNIVDQQQTAQMGASPYASNRTVEGVKYATEAQLYQQYGNLTSQTLANDNASGWERVARKFLGVGALYDDNRIRIRIDDRVLDFGPTDPVSYYLRPDATLIVKDSMFKTNSELIVEAKNQLDVALAMAQWAPEAPRLAYENFLKAAGEKNPSKFLEMPQQMQMAPTEVSSQSAQPMQ